MTIKKAVPVLVCSVLVLAALAFRQASEPRMLFEKAKFAMETRGDLSGAIKLLEDLLQKYPQEREVAAKAQYTIGICFEKQGLAKAREAYEKVVQKYPEQSEAVSLAKAKLASLMAGPAAAAVNKDQFQMRKIWSGPDVDSLGEVSPDGKYLSTVDWMTGDQAVLETGSGKKRRLTDKGPWEKSSEFALFSTWSPDSRTLAYNWFTDSSCEIRTIGIEGPGHRVVSKDASLKYVHPGDWSPDGKYLFTYFSRDNRMSHLGLLSLADGSLRPLKALETVYPSEMRFSRDGRYVVYDLPTQSEPQESNIHVLAVDGSLDAALISSPADEFLVGWAPDGKSVLYTSDQSGTFDLWAVRVTNGKAQGEPELIKKDLGPISPMGFNDAGVLYYGVDVSIVDLYVAEIDAASAKLASPPVRALPRIMGSKLSPDWSPDGTALAYVPQSPPGFELVRRKSFNIVSLETGKIRTFPLDLRSIGRLRWSSDGRSMLVRGLPKDGYWSLFLFDLQTQVLRPLVLTPAGAAISNLSTLDGKDIFFTYLDFPKKVRKLLRYNLDRQSAVEIYQEDTRPGMGDFAISPDGKDIAFVDQPSTLKIMPSGGGEAREILKLQSPEQPVSLTWTNDGRGIVFSKALSSTDLANQMCELWLQPADGGTPRNLGVAMDRISYLRFHPDGKRLVFQAGQMRLEVWAMENFPAAEKPRGIAKNSPD